MIKQYINGEWVTWGVKKTRMKVENLEGRELEIEFFENIQTALFKVFRINSKEYKANNNYAYSTFRLKKKELWKLHTFLTKLLT